MSARIQINITDRGFQVPCLWEVVREVRGQVHERLSAFSTDVRDSAALVAGELAENIVKYSVEANGAPASLKLTISEEAIEVCSSNGVVASQAEGVLDVLKVISSHEDPVELYAEMIEASLNEPTAATQQGFYRIAAVANFSLQAACKENVLTITARREI